MSTPKDQPSPKTSFTGAASLQEWLDSSPSGQAIREAVASGQVSRESGIEPSSPPARKKKAGF